MRTKRGGFLTAMAILLALAGTVDVLKAFTKPSPPGQKVMGLDAPATGIVFLGVRHTGSGMAILGLLLAAIFVFLRDRNLAHEALRDDRRLELRRIRDSQRRSSRSEILRRGRGP